MERLSTSIAKILPLEKESKLKSIPRKILKYAIFLSFISYGTNLANYEFTKYNLSKIEKNKGMFFAKRDCGNNLADCRKNSFFVNCFGGGFGLEKASIEYLEYYRERHNNPFKIV